MSNRVSTPFPVYNDTDGTSLDAGFIFIGGVNSNPINSPIAIFYDAELTMPAENPARTRNGYIVKNGAARQLFCAEPIISILVQNKRKETVWNSASVNLNPGVTTNAVIDTESGKSQAEINTDTLRISENLEDLSNKEEARSNLEVYSKTQVDDKTKQATEEIQGTAKVATEDIAKALNDDTTIVTPKKIPIAVKTALAATGDAPVYGCRAWVCFNGSNGNIKGKGNVSTVTRNSEGNYTIVFEKEMPTADYAWSSNGKDVDGGGDVIVGMPNDGVKDKTKIQVKVVSKSSETFDPPDLCISIIC
ncbi:hypothetical protein ACG94V_21035 [Acinetobacter sp. ULE_I001]|uniref:hypothetical protein n=1 Tax=unclassified Acinetobacter TaxID=196816 RepID=UPI003AF697F6